MTIQDTIAKVMPSDATRAKAADFAENVIKPAKAEFAEASKRARVAARKAGESADEYGSAAVKRGGELAEDLSDAALRNYRIAESSVRDMARRNPSLLIAGATIVAMGLIAWLATRGRSRRW